MTSNDVPQRLRLAIKSKLTTMDAFIDDELPDFIMVMLARKKSEEEMASELEPFLEDKSKSFTSWVMKLFEKLNGMKNAGAISKNTQLQTIRKRRVSSSPSKSRSRSRSRSSDSSRSSTSSSSSRTRSRSRSRSRSRKRSRKVKRSDAYDGPGGRRRGLDLARTYRNSSSEDSYSKGYHNDRKKRDRRLARRREGRYSRSSSSSRSRSRSRRKRSQSRTKRRSDSRSPRRPRLQKTGSKNTRISITPEKTAEEIYREKREASAERKRRIAEENVRLRLLADGDDGFGWSEGRKALQPKPEDPARITQRLIDEELQKIEKEKAELDAEKARLIEEKRKELQKIEANKASKDKPRRRRSRSQDRRRRSRSRNRRSRSRNRRRSRDRDRKRSPLSDFPLRKERVKRPSSSDDDDDVDGVPMERPNEPKKMTEWSPNRGTMIRPPENYEKSSAPKGGKWPEWANNENYKYEQGGPKEPKGGWPGLPGEEELPW